jgi:TatD DNase family protein
MKDLLDIINSWEKLVPKERPNGVFHAFEGSLNDAKKAVEMGFLIGIGGPVTFKNAKLKHELAKELPLESILLETDAPFLAPHPHRAKKNEPAFLPLIAEKIAELKSIPVDKVAESTTANSKFLFFWSIN